MKQRIRIELVIRWREIRRDLVEAEIELLGQQHRRARPDALSHLGIAHDQDDLAVLTDPDESVGCEVHGRRSARAIRPPTGMEALNTNAAPLARKERRSIAERRDNSLLTPASFRLSLRA